MLRHCSRHALSILLHVTPLQQTCFKYINTFHTKKSAEDDFENISQKYWNSQQIKDQFGQDWAKSELLNQNCLGKNTGIAQQMKKLNT